MNTGDYVDEQIAILKTSGIPLSEAAWQTAMLTVGWPYVFGDRGEYCTPARRRYRYSKTAEGKNKDNIKDRCKNFDGNAGCGGCKWFPEGKRVREYDCRGFTYWIILQVYGFKIEGAGATSQWNKASNWKSKGEIKDGIPQGIIVCLFQKDSKKKGVMAHTGLYYNGETCEASNGVQHFTKLNKKWTDWAVPACVEGDTPTPVPPPKVRRTLKRGYKGDDVIECQTDLVKLGYDIGPSGIDGVYGKATMAAVKAFQGASGLKQDGICGPDTWAALDKAVAEIDPPSPEPEPTPEPEPEPTPGPSPEPEPTPEPVTRRTLRRGYKGDDVKECQTDLVKLGYDVGPLGIDGVYGRATIAAVTAFQGDSGLKQDGICGPLTWAALDAAIAKV